MHAEYVFTWILLYFGTLKINKISLHITNDVIEMLQK